MHILKLEFWEMRLSFWIFQLWFLGIENLNFGTWKLENWEFGAGNWKTGVIFGTKKGYTRGWLCTEDYCLKKGCTAFMNWGTANWKLAHSVWGNAGATNWELGKLGVRSA
jgi:hypothetical protein